MEQQQPSQAPTSGSSVAEPSHAYPERPLMAVKVYAPFKVYYDGDAYSISAVNEVGPFDILPHHRNFMCMIVPCDLSIDTPSGIQTVHISHALMHVKADRVVVFVDI